MGNIVYLSHGGGPLPLLNDPGHKAMIGFMHDFPGRIARPDRIAVISAHWEDTIPKLIGRPDPGLLFDYYGFPPETYEVQYPVKGDPSLAAGIKAMLEADGMQAETDTGRGLDHGVFIPLMMMYPEHDIPLVQISLVRGLDPEYHLKIGKALSGLKDENILIIGSGFSFHNMQRFSWQGKVSQDGNNDQFQDWLIETCCGDISAKEREQLLLNWENAPAARYCHPREEHLLPLLVCAAAAGTAAQPVFDDYIMGKRAVAFLW